MLSGVTGLMLGSCGQGKASLGIAMGSAGGERAAKCSDGTWAQRFLSSCCHQPSRAAPGRGTMSPRGEHPPVPQRGGKGGVLIGLCPSGAGQGPPCRRRQTKLGPSFATLPYLQAVTHRFRGNGDGIPNTSGRVSLPPLRCHPLFPG